MGLAQARPNYACILAVRKPLSLCASVLSVHLSSVQYYFGPVKSHRDLQKLNLQRKVWWIIRYFAYGKILVWNVLYFTSTIDGRIRSRAVPRDLMVKCNNVASVVGWTTWMSVAGRTRLNVKYSWTCSGGCLLLRATAWILSLATCQCLKIVSRYVPLTENCLSLRATAWILCWRPLGTSA